MKLDKFGLLEMEQCGWPGNIGDSCAETSRFINIDPFGNVSWITLTNFRTDTGYVRHPSAPPGWREEDFSSDQWLPLYLASHPYEQDRMLKRLQAAKYRTGNGDLISPMAFAVTRTKSPLWDLTFLGQALLFKLPFRYSDSKNKFEPVKESSCDVLNFVHCLLYCQRRGHTVVSKLAKRATDPSWLIQKVQEYYRAEPNSDWIVLLYIRAIRKLYQ